MQSSTNTGVHILALPGNFRKGSLNQTLIQATCELASDHIRIHNIDLRKVPFYDGDLEAAGDPEEVTALKSAIAEADAILVATPEYHGSVPAVLKNALHWASRPPADSPLKDKPTRGGRGGIGGVPGPLLPRRRGRTGPYRSVPGGPKRSCLWRYKPLLHPRLRSLLRRLPGCSPRPDTRCSCGVGAAERHQRRQRKRASPERRSEIQNVADMTEVLHTLPQEGYEIRREHLAQLSPYLTEHGQAFRRLRRGSRERPRAAK
jgi:hypothetical protein